MHFILYTFLYILNKNPLEAHEYAVYFLSIIVSKKELKKDINMYIPKMFGCCAVLKFAYQNFCLSEQIKKPGAGDLLIKLQQPLE